MGSQAFHMGPPPAPSTASSSWQARATAPTQVSCHRQWRQQRRLVWLGVLVWIRGQPCQMRRKLSKRGLPGPLSCTYRNGIPKSLCVSTAFIQC